MGKPEELAQKLQQQTQQGIQAQGQQVSPATHVANMLQRMNKQIEKALPEKLGLTADRFARIALTTIRQTPKLLECSDVSLMAALMQSAQLGLDPSSNLGQAYIIPRWNKNAGCDEAQFQIGYKGYMQLIRRSGEVSDVIARIVYKKDIFECEYGLNEKLVHKPYMEGDPGEAVKYYAIVKFKDGGYSFFVMSKQQVIDHAFKYTKQQKGNSLTGAWGDADKFDGMALKTVFLKLKNWLPLSVDVLEKLETDGSVKNEISPEMTQVVNMVDTETGEVIEAQFQATKEETAAGGEQING